ncbi:DNA repair and recombination protein RAD54B [Entamoeba marina]
MKRSKAPSQVKQHKSVSSQPKKSSVPISQETDKGKHKLIDVNQHDQKKIDTKSSKKTAVKSSKKSIASKPNKSKETVIKKNSEIDTKLSDDIVKVFKMLWTKDLKKKQKVFNDGFFVVKNNNTAVLNDDENKEIGKIQKVDNILNDSVINGEEFTISNKLIQIDSEMKLEDYFSKKLFTNDVEDKVVTQPQHLTKTVLYDSNNPFAYVLDSEHQPVVLIDPYIGKYLRPHQIEGVKFMYNCITRKGSCGCILADEMGLGKTLQTITLIWAMYKQRSIKKTVIVCPQSLIGNWEKEFKKWLGVDRIAVKTGSSDALMKQKVADFVTSYVPVLIISYEQVRSHVEELKKTKIGLIVCDEGHRIKNSSSKTTIALNDLNASRHIVLSGTPVQNGLDDFYTLLEFCTPGCMDSIKSFRSYYGTPIQKAQNGDASLEELQMGRDRAKMLTEELKDYVLRRTSKVNEKYLPDKTEIVMFVKPSKIQIQLYQYMLERLQEERIEICAALQYIQHFTKLCNHPSLISQKLLESNPPMDKNTKKLLESIKINEEMSNKFLVTIRCIKSITSNTQEKVVIVSNYTKTLDVFEKFFSTHKQLNVNYLRLDGKTTQLQRDNSKFNVLLLSSKAGGVGLNLIGCSRLFLFDPDWNPAKDKQAMARIWRDGTIEEKIYQRQLQKTGVSESIVEEHLEAGRSLSQEQLKRVFDLNLDTLSDTHDALNCDCLVGGIEDVGEEKHLLMSMKKEIQKIDPLIINIEGAEEYISMLFVNEFHSEKK